MTKTLQSHKDAAKAFMYAIYPDKEWWIVGGLLRDDMLGISPKDIDIFVNGKEGDLMPSECKDAGDHNAYLLRAMTYPDYEYEGELYEINVIFMRGPDWNYKSIADRCDFGLCQVSWNPVDDNTYMSEEFLKDIENKTFTLYRDTPGSRKERMEKKLPAKFKYVNTGSYSLDGKLSWRYDAETQTIVKSFKE